MSSRESTSRRRFLQLGAAGGLLAAPGAPAPAQRRDHYGLFSEGRIGDLRIGNRLVRAATAEGAAQDGLITEPGIDLHRRLAEGGVGLIITGHMAVMSEGRAEGAHQTCIYDDRFTEAVARIPEAVRAANKNAKVFAQISHAGMQSRIAEPVAPSARPWPRVKRQPRILTTREVDAIVTRFAQAARRVKDAGFDGLELHAAHGYLLSSFLSPYTNTRTDNYGGSLEKRVAIIREIVRQTRAVVGPGFPVIVKMNCDDGVEGGIDADSLPALAAEIVKTGIQAVEVSGANATRKDIAAPEQESYFLPYARKLKLTVPVILTGGNRSVEHMEKIFRQGTPDFFGLARPLLREPDLPRRWLGGLGGERSACISCNRCLQGLAEGRVTRCRVEELGS